MEVQKEMNFLDHLEILRWHLIRIAIVVLASMLLVFFFKNEVFNGVILAPSQSNFWTYELLCSLAKTYQLSSDLCFDSIHFSLINTDLSGQFSMHLWVSFVVGLSLSFPYVLLEIWLFIKPAFRPKELIYARIFLLTASFLFLTGLLFGYFFIAPLSIQFLGSYQVSALVQNQIILSSYISTLTTLSLASALVFQLPVLVYFLAKLGFVSAALMRRFRKHALVVILIFAGIITPPDVVSQLLMTFPLLLLYEISIWIAKFVESSIYK